ncbi:MAG: hypothetical protein ACD_3C00123G0007 [uncultured bacterium (gcode 4)]|uniref:Leucine-binding protein domain-containing protein n=1 Tax=uncultured bacterium (gcode 4) TaxID=1234023 RepID=K2F9X8_9BACT|nr:MAG: hypothetical protein ACD_3C00123G0007 [uncultured bacterium (gcode 4)]
MKTKFYLLFIPVIALVLVSCGQNIKSSVMQSNDTKENIKIGMSLPLTWDAASYWLNVLAWAELAVKEANDNGWINWRKIELVVEDDKCWPKDGVSAVNKLINVNNVDVLAGPVCSAVAWPALSIPQKKWIPTIILGSAPDLLKAGDYIYRTYPSDSFQGKFAADLIYNNFWKKKIAVIYVKNDWGQGIKQVFVDKYKSNGWEIVYEDWVLQDTKDLRTMMSKVKESWAEALYFVVYPGTGVAWIKQAHDLWLNIPIIGWDAFIGDEVVKSWVADGIILTVWHMNNPDEFKAKINKLPWKEKMDVNVLAPFWYDIINVFVGALKEAGSTDWNAVREALKKTNIDWVATPKIEFTSDRELKEVNFDIKIIKDKQAIDYK